MSQIPTIVLRLNALDFDHKIVKIQSYRYRKWNIKSNFILSSILENLCNGHCNYSLYGTKGLPIGPQLTEPSTFYETIGWASITILIIAIVTLIFDENSISTYLSTVSIVRNCKTRHLCAIETLPSIYLIESLTESGLENSACEGMLKQLLTIKASLFGMHILPISTWNIVTLIIPEIERITAIETLVLAWPKTTLTVRITWKTQWIVLVQVVRFT